MRSAAFSYEKLHQERTSFRIFVTLICLFSHVSTATNFTTLANGVMFHDVMRDPPPNVLIEGDCIQYKFPRIMEDLKWGYIRTYREGIMEACMRNCSLEVSEANFPPPNWTSDTEGLGTDCFLKLEDAGGIVIMKGDPVDPVLVKTLRDNDDLTVYSSDNSVGYELYLDDLYEIKADHWLEYGPDRFSKNPSLVLRRMLWTWFPENFDVLTSILATFPDSNVPILDSYEL